MILLSITVFLIILSMSVCIPAISYIITEKRRSYPQPWDKVMIREKVINFDKVEAYCEFSEEEYRSFRSDLVPKQYATQELKHRFVNALIEKDFFKVREIKSDHNPYIKRLVMEGRFAKMSQYDN